jgi:hypothetical protein
MVVDSCMAGTPAANDATCDEVDDDCDGAVDDDCAWTVGFCRLQFPTSAMVAAGDAVTVYGRVYAAGLTDRSDGTDVSSRLVGQVGYGVSDSLPADGGWTWTDATPNLGWDDAVENNNDEYQAELSAPVGTHDYAYRFSGDGGATWVYCDSDGPGNTNGYDVANAGVLTVTGSSPTITSLDYTVLAHGARVTITGTNLAATTDVSIAGSMQMLESADATSATFLVPDATPIGAGQTLTVTTPGGMATTSVTVIHLVIHELDADTPGTDAAEFVELAAGVPNVSLAGYVLVLWNGSNNLSYLALDLNATTDANGLLLVGNTALTPALTFANNFLQNGQDGASVHQGAASSFPNNTLVTATGLLDAVVYDTSDADDPELLGTFYASAEARVQHDEATGGANDVNAVTRCSSARLDGRAFSVLAPPTPGAPNTGCP